MTTLRLAVVGLGRIGEYHARHVAEHAKRTGECVLAALVDPAVTRARELAESYARIHGPAPEVFPSIDALLAAGVSDVAVVSSPTAAHHEHATRLIEAGHRVLLEKPLTGTLPGDREFTGLLNAEHPHALALAFQRRFDPALRHAKNLLDEGSIGAAFKFVSVLEDSRPMPEGYSSPGLLPDMAVHNVDEVCWLSGRFPTSARASGARLYGHRVTTVEEDFDDALLQLDLGDGCIAHIEVSRNHVAGYRVETWIFGEDGVLHVGSFRQNVREVLVELYRRDAPAEVRSFPIPDYGPSAPEFIERFGPAYAAELEHFVACCRANEPFTVDHNDGLRAMEIVDAGQRSLRDDGGLVALA